MRFYKKGVLVFVVSLIFFGVLVSAFWPFDQIFSKVNLSPNCVVPTNNMKITQNIELCPGTYNLVDGENNGAIIIEANNVKLTCQKDATNIVGNGSGIGIFSTGNFVEVSGCNISNYGSGIEVAAGKIYAHDNVLMGNIWGVVDRCRECTNVYSKNYVKDSGVGFFFEEGGKSDKIFELKSVSSNIVEDSDVGFVDSDHGYYDEQAAYIRFSYNIVKNTRTGFEINGNKNCLQGNEVWNAQTGYYIMGNEAMLDSNKAYNSSDYGFYVEGDYAMFGGNPNETSLCGRVGKNYAEGNKYSSTSSHSFPFSSKSSYGFYFSGPNHCYLGDNTARYNGYDGFAFFLTSGVVFSGKVLSELNYRNGFSFEDTGFVSMSSLSGLLDGQNNTNYGLFVSYSKNNTFNCLMQYNQDDGIHIEDGSDYNSFYGTSQRNGGNGLHVEDSGGNSFEIDAVENSLNGVNTVNSQVNVFKDSVVSGNKGNGFLIKSSDNNIIRGLHIENNGDIGILFTTSSSGDHISPASYSKLNWVFNNVLNNTAGNVRDLNHDIDNRNIYNFHFYGCRKGYKNIIGGPCQGGNYWSDYNGKDTNGDGLGDTDIPFNESGSITTGGDEFPLVPLKLDRDNDGYYACSPPTQLDGECDCDDDTSDDPAGCPSSKSKCTTETSRCAICIHPGAMEICDAPVDNNCNGKIDENFPEKGKTCNLGCQAGVWQCSSGKLSCIASGIGDSAMNGKNCENDFIADGFCKDGECVERNCQNVFGSDWEQCGSGLIEGGKFDCCPPEKPVCATNISKLKKKPVCCKKNEEVKNFEGKFNLCNPTSCGDGKKFCKGSITSACCNSDERCVDVALPVVVKHPRKHKAPFSMQCSRQGACDADTEETCTYPGWNDHLCCPKAQGGCYIITYHVPIFGDYDLFMTCGRGQNILPNAKYSDEKNKNDSEKCLAGYSECNGKDELAWRKICCKDGVETCFYDPNGLPTCEPVKSGLGATKIGGEKIRGADNPKTMYLLRDSTDFELNGNAFVVNSNLSSDEKVGIIFNYSAYNFSDVSNLEIYKYESEEDVLDRCYSSVFINSQNFDAVGGETLDFGEFSLEIPSGVSGKVNITEYSLNCPNSEQMIPLAMPECIMEGESGSNSSLEENESLSCCLGLEAVPNLDSVGKDCVVPENSTEDSFRCTACGDGICGVGENICNCKSDCTDVSLLELVRKWISGEISLRDLISRIARR